MNTFVAKLGKYDVLLGRGTGPNEHEGNKEFRELAGSLLKSIDYSSYNKISKRELAEKLVDLVHSKNGRFVRKLSRDERFAVACNLMNTAPNGIDKKKFRKKQGISDLYVVVPINIAIEKAKQSFRHQLTLIPETTSSQQSWSAAQQHDNHHGRHRNKSTNNAGSGIPGIATVTEDEESFINRGGFSSVSPTVVANVQHHHAHHDDSEEGRKFKKFRSNLNPSGPPKKRSFQISQENVLATFDCATSVLPTTRDPQNSPGCFLPMHSAVTSRMRQEAEEVISKSGFKAKFLSLSEQEAEGSRPSIASTNQVKIDNPTTTRTSFLLPYSVPPPVLYNRVLTKGSTTNSSDILDTKTYFADTGRHTNNTLSAEMHQAQPQRTTDPVMMNPACALLGGELLWYQNPTATASTINPTRSTAIASNFAAAADCSQSFWGRDIFLPRSLSLPPRSRLLSQNDLSCRGATVQTPMSLVTMEDAYRPQSSAALGDLTFLTQKRVDARQRDDLDKSCSVIETLHTLLLLKRSSVSS